MIKENPLAVAIATVIADSDLSGWHIDKEGRKQVARCISFRQYMSACLYDQKYGYYRSGPVRVGKEGDFYTSSAIGSVLAEVLAGCAVTYGDTLGQPLKLIEWGAGTGRLSAQIAAAGSNRCSDWADRFQSILIEDHPGHSQAAREAFVEISGFLDMPAAEPLIASSDEAWEASWLKQPALVIANELLDAFPVHRVQNVDGELLEVGVSFDVLHGFYEVLMPLTDSRISGWLARDGILLKDGQRTEIHADAAAFLRRLGALMTTGRLIFIDYGHEAAEYSAEHRMHGTLMCYWRHQASDSPYIRVGEQDMTSHVPFTFIRREAEESGWQVAGFATQKQFLIDHGVLALLQNHLGANPFSKAARMNRAIRQLLLSDQMSETFKVMILDKK